MPSPSESITVDTALKISLGRLRSGQQFDLISQAFQPPHEPSLDSLAVTFIEVVFAQILIRHVALYDMVDNLQDGMAHRDQGFLFATAGAQAMVQGTKLSMFGRSGTMSGFN